MRRKSPDYRRAERTSVGFSEVAIGLCVAGFVLAGGVTEVAAQTTSTDVAYVQSVSGRVIAFSQGKPALVDAFDIIGDQTRLDLQAGSDLELCHYATHKLVSLKGPSRVSISAAALSAEKAQAIPAGTCVEPMVSRLQGGLLARGVLLKSMEVPLEPVVKIANRSSVPVSRVTLSDSDQRTVLAFSPRAVRPVLENGRSYVMGVERADGSELKVVLKGSASAERAPVFVVIQ